MSQQLANWARRQYRGVRRVVEHQVNRLRTPEQVFSRIYEAGAWGRSSGKYCSGTGSSALHIDSYVNALAGYIRRHEIRRVVDLGCGDFVIGRRIADLGVHYIGVDVVPDLVSHHNREFASDSVRFEHLDIINDALPVAELCMIRQVLQHLSNSQISRILDKLHAYQHVIVTEHYPAPASGVVANRDKPHGHDTRVEMDSGVYLDQPPFNVQVLEVLLESETVPLKRKGEQLRTMRIAVR
jgi:SAM-dependent methyltransferase